MDQLTSIRPSKDQQRTTSIYTEAVQEVLGSSIFDSDHEKLLVALWGNGREASCQPSDASVPNQKWLRNKHSYTKNIRPNTGKSSVVQQT